MKIVSKAGRRVDSSFFITGYHTRHYFDVPLCSSERLFKQMADLLVTDGYHDVGYTYINVDDCWLAHERDRHGRLQPDKDRFPSGMKALADYVS